MENSLIETWVEVLEDALSMYMTYVDYNYVDMSNDLHRKPIKKLVIQLAVDGKFKVAYRKWIEYIDTVDQLKEVGFMPARKVWRVRSRRKGSRRTRRVDPYLSTHGRINLKSIVVYVTDWYKNLVLSIYNKWSEGRWAIVEQMHRAKRLAPDLYERELISEVMEYMDVPVRRGSRKKSSRKQSRRRRRSGRKRSR